MFVGVSAFRAEEIEEVKKNIGKESK